MIGRRALFPLSAFVLAELGFAPSCWAAGEGGSRLAIVVAKGSPLQSIGFHELKRLYMGETVNGPEGLRLLALNQSSVSAERMRFDRGVLGMTPEQAARYWIDRKIRGQPGAPKAVDMVEVLQRAVAQLRGAVGYCRLDEVRDGLRVLKIEGKLPTDAGYPVSG
ncbi:MAG TPA: hypothetical protein VFQ61_12680 [Polyangiaceae bacterium]|nr:hypothetical protein [Polyangiaceae bacterium]